MKQYTIISALLLVSLAHARKGKHVDFTRSSNTVLPEKDLSTPELIRYWGYPAESHEVITKDGYHITVHRIPGGKASNNRQPGGMAGKTSNNRQPREKKEVFFLQHGVLCSSADWVINLPHQSLGFVLADAGYDVWIGNVRGNPYAQKHSVHKVNSAAFWSFSFADHAKYDLPAMVNHVLNTTNQDALYYVGHSQGTMMPLAELSDDMTLQKKIKMLFLLSPPTTLANIISPLKYSAPYSDELTSLAQLLGIYDFLAYPSEQAVITGIADKICPQLPMICDLVLWCIMGYDLKNLNNTRLPVYLSHFPAGTSMKNVEHFAQVVNSKKFQSYDYGPTGNTVRYSKTTPLEYYISNINVPTVVMYGTEDWLVAPLDVKWAIARIPNIVEAIEVEEYNHMDFLWATNAGVQVHQKILDIVDRFEPWS